jgi:hypothetical protein
MQKPYSIHQLLRREIIAIKTRHGTCAPGPEAHAKVGNTTAATGLSMPPQHFTDKLLCRPFCTREGSEQTHTQHMVVYDSDELNG